MKGMNDRKGLGMLRFSNGVWEDMEFLCTKSVTCMVDGRHHRIDTT